MTHNDVSCIPGQGARLQVGQRVPGDGAGGGEPAAVELAGGPGHDVGVHAVLHGQHLAGRAAVQRLQPLEQRLRQALRNPTAVSPLICLGLSPQECAILPGCNLLIA